MNILVLADTHTVGEWNAIISAFTWLRNRNKKYHLFLVSYGALNASDNELFYQYFQIPNAQSSDQEKGYWQLLEEFVVATRALRAIKKHSFDLIIGSDYRLILASFFIFRSIPKLFWFHGFRHVHISRPAWNHVYTRLQCALEKLCWIGATQFLIPSKSALTLVQRELGIYKHLLKPEILPNTVHPFFLSTQNRTKKAYSSNMITFLYSGRIAEKKGLPQLVEAFEAYCLHAHESQSQLIIAYPSHNFDANLYNLLIQKVQKSHLHSRIKFIKDASRHTIKRLYADAFFCILPSELEVSSMFALESLASGTPILATAVGENMNLLTPLHETLLLNNNSPLVIAKHLEAISQKIFPLKSIRIKIKRLYNKTYFQMTVNKLEALLRTYSTAQQHQE